MQNFRLVVCKNCRSQFCVKIVLGYLAQLGWDNFLTKKTVSVFRLSGNSDDEPIAWAPLRLEKLRNLLHAIGVVIAIGLSAWDVLYDLQ